MKYFNRILSMLLAVLIISSFALSCKKDDVPPLVEVETPAESDGDGNASKPSRKYKKLDRVIETKIHVGLEKPVQILHITDVHLIEFTLKDPPSYRKFLKYRDVFRQEAYELEGRYPNRTPNQYFEDAIAFAEDNGYLLVNTGDTVDFNSPGNYEEFHRIIKGHDMMYTPGGHEFQCRHHRTLEEPYPYAETVIPQVREIMSEYDLTLDSRIINGLNVVTIDNSMEYFTKEANERLRAEIAKGFPILLFMHVPISNRYLNRITPPPPEVRLTEMDWRISDDTLRLICECPLIVATVAGHSHAEYVTTFHEQKVYVTPQLCAGVARLITID